MNEELNKLIVESLPNQESAERLLNRLFDAAEPEAVYGKPTKVDDYTIITASELTVAFGAGFGSGAGTGPEPEDAEEVETPGGVGGGGGGGGTTMARPVAAIAIGPSGVEVKPIVDPTKFGIAIATAVGAMFIALARMWRFSKSNEM